MFLHTLIDNISSLGLRDKTSVDEKGEVSDNILIRKLYWTLNIPCVEEVVEEKTKQNVKRPSILHNALFDEKNVQMIDLFIKLILYSEEYRLSDLVGNFQCFEQAYEIESTEIQKFLEESYFQTQACLEIKTIKWKPGANLITFGSKHSILSADAIVEEIRKR